MTDDFAVYTHTQRALPAGFQKSSSLLADLTVLKPRNLYKFKKKSLFQRAMIGMNVAGAERSPQNINPLPPCPPPAASAAPG